MAHLIRWFTYWKCWFSIAMLNCQKVTGNQSQIKVSSKWSKPLVARAQLLGWPSKVLGGSKILWKPPLNSVGSISPGLALYIFYNIYRVWGHNKKTERPWALLALELLGSLLRPPARSLHEDHPCFGMVWCWNQFPYSPDWLAKPQAHVNLQGWACL